MYGRSPMHWLSGLKGRVSEHAPLAALTWYRLGGPARWLVSPDSDSDLREIVYRASDSDVPFRVLGGGANVLIRDDGFDGVVVRLDHVTFTGYEIDGTRVRAGAGVDLIKLTRDCSKMGLSGIEGLAGIPGTLGGAIRMNAGGRYGQIADVVEDVGMIDGEGQHVRRSREELGFGYRTSGVGTAIVTQVVLKLTRDTTGETWPRYCRIWAEKIASQPLASRSAGCVFKNPHGARAGELIDRAGLKGFRIGGARVSDRHGNFVIADDGAKSADVFGLIEHVREVVARASGIVLETEVDIW